jgi:hypothetical protein
MVREKKNKEPEITSPPDKESPDYFRSLVWECIKTFEKLPNNRMALDYCRVSGKLRAMVLEDAEYKEETRNIYARQRLQEIEELDRLAALASGKSGEPEEEEFIGPRGRNERSAKKKQGIDKDAIATQFRIAQMKRELLAELASDAGDVEKNAAYLLFVSTAREEFVRLEGIEVNEASSCDEALQELTGTKEAVPEGTSGKMRTQGSKTVLREDDFFDVDPVTGAVVEK